MTIRDDLETRGFVATRADRSLADEAMTSPFAAAARVIGEAPLFVERQNIRPMLGGRSIASSRGDAPFHTDSQMILGVPPTVQILVCARDARWGGETILVDAFATLERLAREDAPLFAAAFDEPVSQTFYFGEVRGPIAALRGGHLAVTHAPHAVEGSAPARFARELAREAPIELALRDGDVLVASNHRLVHGRRAFDDASERELVRLLVWLERPLAAPPALVARAREVAGGPPAATAVARVRAVTALLRGAPPARVAADAGLRESELYALRDRFLAGGMREILRET